MSTQHYIWYRILTSYACFMVTADANTGVVTEAAPIAKWAVGKKIDAVLKYYREKKGAEIEQLR